MKPILAWYFSDDTRKLRYGDGRKIALGIEHTVKGNPEPCKHGLHGSERLLDALQYALGTVVWRVELSGSVKKESDKIAATRRRYIGGGVDITDILRAFARKQALSVAHLWNMPVIVRQYLETGDAAARAAAYVAAYAAARAAADAAYAADAAAYAADVAADVAAYAAARAADDAAYAAAEQMLVEMVEEAIK